MPQAIMNYSKFMRTSIRHVEPHHVKESSAGTYGWAHARVEDWKDGCPAGPLRSGKGWPPAADDDWHGEKDTLKKNKVPPESKPQVILAYQAEIEARDREVRWQQRQVREGERPNRNL